MNTIKNILLAFLLGGASYCIKAQSSNFSQYHLTPVYTSPAALGTTDYFQILSHYRKQSLSQDQGYENFALSGIYPLYYKDDGRRFGGIGVGIMNEHSGMMGILKETSVKAGYAYNWQVSRFQHVSIGLQGGYYRTGINLGKIRTDSQYGNGTYDPDMALGENFSDNASQAFKMDAGATWYAQDDTGDHLFSLGIAAFNINRAGFKLMDGSQDQPAPVRYQVYGSIKVLEKNRLHITPTFRYMLEKNYSQLNLGSLFLYQLQEAAGSLHQSHLGVGLWYSLNNAAIVSVELVQPSYILSFSCDISAASKFEQANINNGVELTLGWRLNKDKGL